MVRKEHEDVPWGLKSAIRKKKWEGRGRGGECWRDTFFRCGPKVHAFG